MQGFIYCCCQSLLIAQINMLVVYCISNKFYMNKHTFPWFFIYVIWLMPCFKNLELPHLEINTHLWKKERQKEIYNEDRWHMNEWEVKHEHRKSSLGRKRIKMTQWHDMKMSEWREKQEKRGEDRRGEPNISRWAWKYFVAILLFPKKLEKWLYMVATYCTLIKKEDLRV